MVTVIFPIVMIYTPTILIAATRPKLRHINENDRHDAVAKLSPHIPVHTNAFLLTLSRHDCKHRIQHDTHANIHRVTALDLAFDFFWMYIKMARNAWIIAMINEPNANEPTWKRHVRLNDEHIG
jgi:hypothetical protein